MALAAEASLFLGTLTGILHLFNIFPSQPNAKVAAHGLLAGLSVLLLLIALAAGRFSNVGLGVLAILAAAGSLWLSVAAYQNRDPRSAPGLITAYAACQVLALVLVFGGAGLGLVN